MFAVVAMAASVLWSPLLSGPSAAEAAASATHRVAAASMDASYGHTCVVLTTGGVRCWGFGLSGQLGQGNDLDVGDGMGASIQTAGNVPIGPGLRAVAVSAGQEHTCALMSSGTVRCWGSGQQGQLGYNNTASVGDGLGPSIPSAGDVPIGATATQITTGGDFSCALLTTGAVRCWGDGGAGQLGHDNTMNIGAGMGSPTIEAAGDVPLGGQATAITAGTAHACALMATGAVRCWGFGLRGQLGYGSKANVGDGVGNSVLTAGDVPLGAGAKAVAVTAGGFHTCALLTTGAVRCWGENADGELGYDSKVNVGDGVGPSISTAGDVPLGGKATAISAGPLDTCAALTTGAVRCWGQGFYGRLGHDNTNNIGDGSGDSTIVAAGDVPLGGNAVGIAAGQDHTCALLDRGAVRCWGRSTDGQLGHDNRNSVGDGNGDKTIIAAGDVPVGASVQVRSTTTLTATATPSRDRKAPFTYALTGRVRTTAPSDATICQGLLKITVRKGRRTLQTRRVQLDNRCGYHSRIRITGTKLPLRKATRLTARIRFVGTANLEPTETIRRLTAH